MTRGAGGLPSLQSLRLGPEGSLAAAVLAGTPETGELFPETARAPATWLEPGPSTLQRNALGASAPAVRTKLDAILDGGGLLVSTGQQPALFLGPLYILYKLLTAAEVARRLEERLGVPCLPLFWIASDDHDWQEVAHTRLIDLDGSLRTFRIEAPPGREAHSVGPSSLPRSTPDVLDEFLSALPASEYHAEVEANLREAYVPGRSFAAAFQACLGRVMGEREWAWIDSSHESVRRSAGPLLRRALESGRVMEESFRAGTQAVEGVGFSPQMSYLPGASQVFWHTDGGRQRIYLRDDARARPGRKGQELPLAEVLALLDADPQSFSPTASFRPILESWLLPIAATVLGPGEIAYWAQLRPLFEASDVAMPRVEPRFAWRVVEARIGRILEKVGAEPNAFAHPDDLAHRLIKGMRPAGTEAALRRLREELDPVLERVDKAVRDDFPGLRSAVGKARKAVFHAVTDLEHAIESRLREREHVFLEQSHKAALHLYPDGRPQERVLNPFYLLARYGPGFVDELDRQARDRVPRP